MDMTTYSSTDKNVPLMGKYRLSRRGRKLPVSDDQRTLLALPKDVPERTWAEILQKEDNDLVCFDIREEIFEEAMRIGYEKYMDRQTVLFTVHCAEQAWLKLIDWQFYRHDPGEDPSSYPPCYIPKRLESWIPDERPDPSPKDTWCRQRLKVIEDTPDETVVSVESSSSVEMVEVPPIPKEYWFPGKVNFPTITKVHRRKTVAARGGVQDPNAKGKPLLELINEEGVWNYVWTVDSSEESGSSASDHLGAESEVLQKVTDYSTEEVSHKPSATSVARNPTPVEGSLHGAGDSMVALDSKLAVKRSRRRFDKSKSSFMRPSMTSKSRGGLPPLNGDSRSRISVISDCRLRNLRLDTQYEITSEKLNTPPGEPNKRK